MFLLTTTKMSEFMTIHPSHFGCIKSTVLAGMRKMYIDISCPNLGIGIKISGVLIGPAMTDPNKGCCVVMCIFIETYNFRHWKQTEKTHRKIFSCFFI